VKSGAGLTLNKVIYSFKCCCIGEIINYS